MRVGPITTAQGQVTTQAPNVRRRTVLALGEVTGENLGGRMGLSGKVRDRCFFAGLWGQRGAMEHGPWMVWKVMEGRVGYPFFLFHCLIHSPGHKVFGRSWVSDEQGRSLQSVLFQKVVNW